ncbi:SDR family oxidoreductase [Pseudomonas argentinensis]|uniref:Cyclic-di-GMP-binding biofilm dispersal mediator protein n=1 Tax=Phytopseudomonas argentinensis TaxID=289370 RepID=A0A1I3KJ51_9GAMM|nr:SDR family oxidoreductase [Pseudomonas argentinensis]KAB0550562.1 SDR family oxidoreductase [Pseudomonas argentinensis]SFI72496.1 cyclic-di-GMP-binding biofilm dispersal mediator protein [Pseudomonas argentinensis]
MPYSQPQSVLVLGGSRGIGAAIVRRFASDGARVTFTYASSAAPALELAEQTGSTALQLDSADRQALTSAIEGLGAIDVVVVNAGVFVGGDPLELDADAVDRLFTINVNAPYHAAVSAARQMPDGGRIILIGSTNADRVPMPGVAAYSASKAALTGMVKGLARDFGPRGITVNLVQPGPTDTDMNPADGPLNDLMHSFMAIKRHARSEEVAGMVAWLSGSEARLVTGAALTLDGGFAA